MRGAALGVAAFVCCLWLTGEWGALSNPTGLRPRVPGRGSPAMCDLCNDYRWLFIVGEGRSGSTTIMEMLDTIPFV